MNKLSGKPPLSKEQAIDKAERLRRAVQMRSVSSEFDRSVYLRDVAELESIERRLMIQNEIEQFMVGAAAYAWPSKADFLIDLASFWFDKLAELTGNYEHPIYETCCDVGCVFMDHSVFLLCSNPPIYGCAAHGTLHSCDGRDCIMRLTTPTWTEVCLFSGAEVGKKFAQVASLAQEYNSADARHAGLMCVAVRLQHGGIETLEARDSLATLLDRVRKGERLNLQQPIVDASGTVTNSTPEQMRTFRWERTVRNAVDQAEKEWHVTAERVVKELLFTVEPRDLLNIQTRTEATRKARDNLIAYYRSERRAGSMPSRITAAMIYAAPFNAFTLLPTISLDQSRLSRLSRLAIEIWRVCHKSPHMESIRNGGNGGPGANRRTSATFVQTCIGVLYMHQKGFSIQMNEQHGVAPRTYVIVPREKRMDFELPAPNRIDVFGDAATRRLRDLVVNGKISSATEDGAVSRKRRAVLDNLFKKNGQFTNRKQRHSQRNSGNSSGSRRICMRQNANNPRVSAAERDIMPAHLLALPMRHPDVYETADVSTGMTFIRECIFSFPQRQIPQLIRPITEIVSEIAYNRQ